GGCLDEAADMRAAQRSSKPQTSSSRGFVLVVLVVCKYLSHLLGGDASFLPASGSGSLQHSNKLRVGAEGAGLVVCVVHWDKCCKHDTLIHDHNGLSVHLLDIFSQGLSRFGQFNLLHSALSSPPMKTRLPRWMPTATTVTVWGSSVTS